MWRNPWNQKSVVNDPRLISRSSPQPLPLVDALHRQGSLRTKCPCRQNRRHKHTWLHMYGASPCISVKFEESKYIIESWIKLTHSEKIRKVRTVYGFKWDQSQEHMPSPSFCAFCKPPTYLSPLAKITMALPGGKGRCFTFGDLDFCLVDLKVPTLLLIRQWIHQP